MAANRIVELRTGCFHIRHAIGCAAHGSIVAGEGNGLACGGLDFNTGDGAWRRRGIYALESGWACAYARCRSAACRARASRCGCSATGDCGCSATGDCGCSATGDCRSRSSSRCDRACWAGDWRRAAGGAHGRGRRRRRGGHRHRHRCRGGRCFGATGCGCSGGERRTGRHVRNTRLAASHDAQEDGSNTNQARSNNRHDQQPLLNPVRENDGVTCRCLRAMRCFRSRSMSMDADVLTRPSQPHVPNRPHSPSAHRRIMSFLALSGSRAANG